MVKVRKNFFKIIENMVGYAQHYVHTIPFEIGWVANTDREVNIYFQQTYYIDEIFLRKTFILSIPFIEIEAYIDHTFFDEFLSLTELMNEYMDMDLLIFLEYLLKFKKTQITGKGKFNKFFNILFDLFDKNMINITKYEKYLEKIYIIYENENTKKRKFVRVTTNKEPIYYEDMENILLTIKSLKDIKNTLINKWFHEQIYLLHTPDFPIIEFNKKSPIMEYLFAMTPDKYKLIDEYIEQLQIKEPKIADRNYKIEDFFDGDRTSFVNFENYIKLFKNKKFKEFIKENKKFKSRYPNYEYIFDFNEKLIDILNVKYSNSYIDKISNKIHELLNFYKENREDTIEALHLSTLYHLIIDYKNVYYTLSNKIEDIEINNNAKNIFNVLTVNHSEKEKYIYFLLWIIIHSKSNLSNLSELRRAIEKNKDIDLESEIVNLLIYNSAIYMRNKGRNIEEFIGKIKKEEYKDRLKLLHIYKKSRAGNYNETIDEIRQIQNKHNFTDIENFIIEIYIIILDLHLHYGNLKYPINKKTLNKLKKFFNENKEKFNKTQIRSISLVLDLYHIILYEGNCKNKKCSICKNYISDTESIKEKEQIIDNFLKDFIHVAKIHLESINEVDLTI